MEAITCTPARVARCSILALDHLPAAVFAWELPVDAHQGICAVASPSQASLRAAIISLVPPVMATTMPSCRHETATDLDNFLALAPWCSHDTFGVAVRLARHFQPDRSSLTFSPCLAANGAAPQPCGSWLHMRGELCALSAGDSSGWHGAGSAVAYGHRTPWGPRVRNRLVARSAVQTATKRQRHHLRPPPLPVALPIPGN